MPHSSKRKALIVRGHAFLLICLLSLILTACVPAPAAVTPRATAAPLATPTQHAITYMPAPARSPILSTTMLLTDTATLLALFPAKSVTIQPLQDVATMPHVWVVLTSNAVLDRPHSQPFIALYSQDPNGWHQINRIYLSGQLLSGFEQVVVEPTHRWFEVYSFSGIETTCYALLMFDGQQFKQAIDHCGGQRSTDPSVQRSDLDHDGIPEIILNQSECVRTGPHQCDILLPAYEVRQWDGAQMAPVSFKSLPNTLPDNLRQLNRRAIAAARAGLWKDAQSAIDQALTLQPHAHEIVWNARLIHFDADARAESRSHYGKRDPFECLAHNLVYGDYAAIIEQMRALSPTEIFSRTSPLLLYNADTISMKRHDEFDATMAAWFTATTSLAIQAQPDLANAYFLRGWAIYLTNAQGPQVLADITRAAQLAPTEPLFRKSVQYLQRRIS